MVERNRTSRIMDDDQLKATFEDGSFIIDESNVPRSIYVTGFSRATNPDNLIIQFQKQRNGGGDIESIVINRKKGAAVITFDNEEVVQSIQQKEQKYEGAILSVKSYDAAFKKDEDSEEVLQRSRSPVLVQQPVNPLVKPGKISNEDRNENIQLSSGKQCRPVAMAGRSGTTKWTYAQQDTPESFQLGQKDREERSESDLERQRSAKGVLEQHGDVLQTTPAAIENKWQELENSFSAAQRALNECRSNNDVELSRLINEISRLERFELEQREREEHFESELERERNAREDLEQHAANLQITLYARKDEIQSREIFFRKREAVSRQNERHLVEKIKLLKEEKGNIENRCSELLNEKNTLEEEVEEKTNEIDRILQQQEEREIYFAIELERERNGKEGAEQRAANLQATLTATENQVQELQASQRNEARDWVLSRDEIHPSDKVVGKGAWATVYQGKFRGCKVAVKIIHELILSPHSRRLFEREMMIAATCRHPCLLQFIGATNDDGNPLFVTQLMESSLRTQLEKRTLSEADVTAISLDVAQALNYLHLKKPSPIIHHDISSANVLLWRQGELWRGKVSDYGTANFIRQTMTLGPGAMIYCAPEALTPNQTIKMDVYSFGVLLCEMCIRELPDPQNREEQVTMVTDRMLQNKPIWNVLGRLLREIRVRRLFCQRVSETENVNIILG